jgi:hypothetical protein
MFWEQVVTGETGRVTRASSKNGVVSSEAAPTHGVSRAN